MPSVVEDNTSSRGTTILRAFVSLRTTKTTKTRDPLSETESIGPPLSRSTAVNHTYMHTEDSVSTYTFKSVNLSADTTIHRVNSGLVQGAGPPPRAPTFGGEGPVSARTASMYWIIHTTLGPVSDTLLVAVAVQDVEDTHTHTHPK